MELQTAARYRLLDELRGLDLISMMLYHGMWDVVFLFGVAQKWYTGRPGFVWQQSICWVFLLLSGFCLPLGHHPFRRGAVVFGAGALVTAVTLLFLPEDVVWFGVLTLLGSSMLLTAAPVGLPAAGLDGPSLAGALSAPSAGHPGGADGGVPAGESGVKLLEKLASATA